MNNNYLNLDNINGFINKRLRLCYADGVTFEIIPSAIKTIEREQIGQKTHKELTFHYFCKDDPVYITKTECAYALSSKYHPKAYKRHHVMNAERLRDAYDMNYKTPKREGLKSMAVLFQPDEEKAPYLYHEWAASPTYEEFITKANLQEGKWEDEGEMDFIYEWGGYFRVASGAHMLKIITVDGEASDKESQAQNKTVTIDHDNLAQSLAEMELSWKALDIAILPNLEIVQDAHKIKFDGNSNNGSKYFITRHDGTVYMAEICQIDGSYTKEVAK